MSIRKSEWFLTFSLLTLLISLFAIAKIQSGIADYDESDPIPMVKIEIRGAVAKPGDYLIERGTPFKLAIQKAKPSSFANFRDYDLNQPIMESKIIDLKELPEIRVIVKGAIEQITQLHLPPRTRVCQIKRLLPLHPKADLAQFKSRRYLKDGETIVIPLQTAPANS